MIPRTSAIGIFARSDFHSQPEPSPIKIAGMKNNAERQSRFPETLRRAFTEFLTIPTLIIAGFFLLAVITYALDAEKFAAFEPLRAFLRQRVFRDAKATSDLLSTIAGSLITVTSITFSLLLLAVQQSAATLTNQVYDQFLRRKLNQIYFGFFVGLSLFTLLVLATVAPPYNPVFGASAAFLLTIIALYLVILLLYTTIDQMRPAVIVEAIHDHILIARERQLPLLRRTRRFSQSGDANSETILATKHGFVARVDAEALGAASSLGGSGLEIILRISVGSAVAFQDPLAQIKSAHATGTEKVAEGVRAAIQIEQQRDLDHDPAYGIEQLTLPRLDLDLDRQIKSFAGGLGHSQPALFARLLECGGA